MRSARFQMAIRAGVMVVPSGGIAIFGPQAEDDLSDFARSMSDKQSPSDGPSSDCTVITAFKPDYDHFAQQGFSVAADAKDAPKVDLAIVCLPRAKPAARDMLAQAGAILRPGGRIVIDGQKNDGIGAVLKDLSDLGADLGEIISKAHGKLAVFAPPPALKSWAAQPRLVEGGFITYAGVFSADGPDRASQLLAAALPARLPARVADFGAGWGFLSRAILTVAGVSSLDIIDADARALDCARQNITDPRAVFHWADVASVRPALPWEAVVMNPPFHTQRSANAGIGLAFITAAHARLASNGQLWLVANRQLPYASALRVLFRDVDELGNDATFRLIRAAFPQRTRQ